MKDTIKIYLERIVLSIFPILVFCSIFTTTQDIYFWDDWEFFEGVNGPLSLAWLFKLHNEHWLVFTRLIYYIDYNLFEGRKILAIGIQYVIQLYILVFFYRQFYSINLPLFAKTMILVFLSSVLFSSQMNGIWFWGFAIQQSISVFLFILFVNVRNNLTYDFRDVRFYIPVTLIVFGLFASALGWLGVLLGIAYAIVHRPARSSLIIMLPVVAVSLALYLYLRTGGESSPESINFANVMFYFFSYLGSIASNDSTSVSLAVGLCSCLLIVMLLVDAFKQRQISESEVSLYLILFFVLGTAALAAFGRSSLGIEQSLDSRYIALTSVYWVSLLALVVKHKLALLTSKEAMFFIGVVTTHWYYLYASTSTQKEVYIAIESDKKVQAQAIECGYFIAQPHSVYSQLYPNVEKITDWIVTARDSSNYHIFDSGEHCSLIGKPLDSFGFGLLDTKVRGAFEKVFSYEAETSSQISSAYEIQGWSDGLVHEEGFNQVLIVQGGLIVGTGSIGYSRKDVQSYYQIKQENVGIRGFVDPEFSGDYPFQLFGFNSDKGEIVEIKPGA